MDKNTSKQVWYGVGIFLLFMVFVFLAADTEYEPMVEGAGIGLLVFAGFYAGLKGSKKKKSKN